MQIGEFAAKVGINPKTIRYYETRGLLPSPPRTEAGYRIYGDGDLERLQFILKGRAIGLSLEEIGSVLGMRDDGQEPCEHVRVLLDVKLAAIDEQLRALNELRAEFLFLRGEADGTTSSDDCVCGIIEHYKTKRSTGAASYLTAAPKRERTPAPERSPH